MDLTLSEEQEMLRKTARDFLEKFSPEKVVREMQWDERGYSPELWKKLAELGWLGVAYPERYGGTGGNILDLALIYEEMGRVMFPSPHLSTVVLCGLLILNAGSEKQKAELLPKIASGDLVMALAWTEPGASWEADGISVQATPDGEGYIIDGTKLFVHDASVADKILCVTRTSNEGAAEKGITLFLVDTKSPGLRRTMLKTIAGNNKQCELRFNNVRVPRKNIIGRLNGGWGPLEKVMRIGAVMECAQMVGGGQKVLELTVEYTRTRVQFDAPIGVNQYVQDHCVHLLTYVETSRLMTYQAAWKLSQGLPGDLEVAMAKAWTSDSHEKACWRAHQVFAGSGFVRDSVLPLYTMRGKVHQLYLGDAAYYRKRVANDLDKWKAPPKPRGKPLKVWEKGGAEPWHEKDIPKWPWAKSY